MNFLEKKAVKIKSLNSFYYTYRYDFFSLLIVFTLILWFFSPLFHSGHIVFSDLDFPLNSKRYLEEILGLWNDKWNTPTTLNLPRIISISFPYLLSSIFGYSGSVFIKSFILLNILISSLTMYLFSKFVIRVYLGEKNTLLKLLAISIGSIFYAINPWVIFRIQHIYLLCGYSLMPLALLLFLKVFDPKFQTVIIKGYSPYRIKLYKNNILNLGLLAITISVMSAAIHYFFYALILMVILWFLLLIKQILINRWAGFFLKKAICYNFLIKGIILALLTLIFSYYWFSVYLGSILADAQSSQNNINVVDTLSLFSKNSSIIKSALMVSYWWPMFDLTTLGSIFYIGGFSILIVIAVGIIFYIKKNHLLLFIFILTSVFLLFSTGTTLPYFADLFIKVVMDTPFFGNLFRDPNKLIGVVAIGYSLFLVFGVEKIFSLKIKGINKNYIIKVSFFLLIIVSYLLYINPFRERFINGFYYPVKVPEEYRAVQNNYLNDSNRVLHFPVSGNMLQTSTGVTTLDWNDNPDDFGEDKATGDINVYFSEKNTIFHHEGSDPSISYYINFLQYMLDHGLTENWGQYLYPLGVGELAYGMGYLGHKERQRFNLDVLKKQKDLSLHYSSDYFNLFETSDKIEPDGVLDRLIYTSKGFHSVASISSIPGFSYNTLGIVYNSESRGNPLLTLREGDYIETTTLDELLLASLPEEYYLSPAEHVNNGNPFLGWSRSAIHTSDWLWHLKSQNIKPLRFDMSFMSGLALSFSSIRLDIPVHKKSRVEGKKYLAFDDFIYDGYGFTAENSSIVDIETYPLSLSKDLPLVHGIISKGQSYNIWQVGKSGLIPADEETPYQFFLTISGKGTNKMHLKARFYNEKKQEVGTAYILTPEESIDFEHFKFYGEYITPKDTEYIRIDILSFQRPEQKTHWWIHDFSIFELSEYSVPNTVEMTYLPKNSETLIPFIRLFHSPEGGDVKVSVGDSENIINTKKFDFSGFLWKELKPYKSSGKKFNVIIENLGGFNGINEMVLISRTQLEKERFILNSIMERAEHFISLESEYDFDYKGSIQSKRNLTSLSMGQGRASYNGVLTSKIDLPRDGEYYITMQISGEENKSHFNINLKSEHKNGDFQKRVTAKKSVTDKLGVYIEDVESIDNSYFKVISDTPGVVSNFQEVVVKSCPLPKGQYDLEIQLMYSGESLICVEDLKYFNPSLVLVPDYKEPVDLDGYSECISITEDMIRHKMDKNELTISYDSTCSADWYITSSSEVDVIPGDEYIVSYNMISKGLRSRHSKILYLNSRGQVIKTDFIPEVEESNKSEWNSYQYISKAPDNAKTMLFHIWGRGNKKLGAMTRIKDLTVYPYKNLPLLDKVYISRVPINELFKAQHDKTAVFKILNKDSMSRKFINVGEEGKSVALKFDISPHPIWEMNISGDNKRSEVNINGLRALFFTDKSGEGEVKTILKEHYVLGFILWPIGLLLIYLLYQNAKERESFLRRVKRTLKEGHLIKRR